MKRPIVLVTTRRTLRKHKYIDYVGEYHLELLMGMDILPVLVPVANGTLDCLPDYIEQMAGLLIVEGEDIEPHRYNSRKANFAYLEKTHPLKDEVEIRLLRYAIHEGFPIFGICRGSQLLNVVRGGTLYGDVQKEKKSDLKHISPGEEYDSYRHAIKIVPGTPLRDWYRRSTIHVNSYHHQGVRQLASGLKPMAYAEDGLVEAFFDPKADFRVGLQFHPERMLPAYQGNRRVWEAFGAAVHKAAAKNGVAA